METKETEDTKQSYGEAHRKRHRDLLPATPWRQTPQPQSSIQMMAAEMVIALLSPISKVTNQISNRRLMKYMMSWIKNY